MSIVIEHLNYIYSENTAYQRQALKDINLEIPEGQFIGLIGHTGSGKSTLTQHLNGLLKASGGVIRFNGENIYDKDYDMRKLRAKVGLVFQYPEHQLFEVDVISDVCFGPKNQGLSEEEAKARAANALRLTGISEEMFHQSPFDLSGGQKRRVAIAGVLAMEPEVLILDEPSAGLDPAGRRSLLRNIKEYHRERGTTVVMVSHSMDEVAENVDRIIVLADAGVVMSGTPREVFSRAGELVEVGLDVPQVTRVAMALRERGVDVDPAVYTVADLRRALNAVREGGR